MSKDVKRKVTCTTPYGVVSRTTARTYTHAVVVRVANGNIRAMAWCGNERLAQSQFKYWRNNMKYRFPSEQLETWELFVFPVDKADSLTDEWRHAFAKDGGHAAIPKPEDENRPAISGPATCARCDRPIVKGLGGVK